MSTRLIIMFTLFIDTHNENINLAIYKDGNVINSIIKQSSKSHSIYVMSLIINLINEANISKEDIKEIIVVNGPGSFTGVRIGVTIAKTWAFTQNIKIKQISSLELLACNVKSNEKLIAISDSKGCYIGKFNSNNELLEDYKYITKSELEEKENVFFEENITIDYNVVYDYTLKLSYINPHKINPLYIKKIGVEK